MLRKERGLKKNKWFLSNLFNLSLINALNFASPFIILPILIVSLGEKQYGEYIFYYTIFSLFGFVLNFGTTQSGILLLKKNKYDQTLTFWEIIIFKFLIFSSLTILAVLVFSISDFELNRTYLLLYFIPIFEIISSDWIFHKKEKLNHLALITFCFRIIPLMYVLIFNQGITITGYLISCNYGLLLSILVNFFLMKSYGIELLNLKIRISKIIKYLTPYFVPFIVGKFKLNLIKVGLGIEGNFPSITTYDFLDKVKSGYALPSQIASDSYLGRNTMKPTRKRLYSGLKITLFLGLFFFLIIYFITLQVLKLNLLNIRINFNLLSLFLVLGFVQGIVYFLTKNFLIPNGHIVFLNRLTLFTGLALLMVIILLFYLQKDILKLGVISYIILECTSLVLISYKIIRK